MAGTSNSLRNRYWMCCGGSTCQRQERFDPKPSVDLRAWVEGYVPVGCGVEMDVFLLLRQEGCIKRAQCY